jgi:23S rRNA (cytidine1920-2'-O)/16S rRNA (cytidine1409-2'-O)-methyltransferase
MRRRLDTELVRRGLVESRARAQQAIGAGRVLVSGTLADRASRLVDAAEPIHLAGPPPRFVSRGGDKLDAALERFGVEVAGRRALDAGASTGGFTDCLLQRGAARVVAVDVGRGQLAWSLRTDPRVQVLEGTNVRGLTPDDIGGPVEVAVADLSFISLGVVAPALAGVLARAAVSPGAPGVPVNAGVRGVPVNAGVRGVPVNAEAVFLIKPQFEAGRAEVGRGGIVSDPAVHRRVLVTVSDALASAGLIMVAVMASPLRGATGNVEFLGHFRPGAGAAVGPGEIDAAVAEGHVL